MKGPRRLVIASIGIAAALCSPLAAQQSNLSVDASQDSTVCPGANDDPS